MSERFTPPEVNEAQKRELQQKKPNAETISRIQNGPEAVDVSKNHLGPNDNLITPEKTELYHSPETTKEIEPGHGRNPSWSAPPTDMSAPDPTAQDNPGDNEDKE